MPDTSMRTTRPVFDGRCGPVADGDCVRIYSASAAHDPAARRRNHPARSKVAVTFNANTQRGKVRPAKGAGRAKATHHPTAKAPSNMWGTTDRAPDLSSPDALWQSLSIGLDPQAPTARQQLDGGRPGSSASMGATDEVDQQGRRGAEEKGHMSGSSIKVANTDPSHALGCAYGQVVGIDVAKGLASVQIWKCGDEVLIQNRPLQWFPYYRVERISQQQFYAICKQPYLRHKSLQLALKGRGEDEDMPISLIAYNNEIINDLLNRTYKKGGPGNKSDRVNALDNGFAEIREELHNLMDGMRKTRIRKKDLLDPSKIGTDSSSPTQVSRPRLTQDEVAELRFARERTQILASPSLNIATAVARATPTQGLTSPSPSQSQLNVSQSGGYRTSKPTPCIARMLAAQNEDAAEKIGRDLGGRLSRLQQQSTDGTLRFRPESRGESSPRAMSPAFMTQQPAELQPLVEIYTVKTVRNEGLMVLQGAREERGARSAGASFLSADLNASRTSVESSFRATPEFRACLEGVVVPPKFNLSAGLDPSAELRKMTEGFEVEATHCGVHPQKGVVSLSIKREADGLWIQHAMVSKGLAYVEGAFVVEASAPIGEDGDGSGRMAPSLTSVELQMKCPGRRFERMSVESIRTLLKAQKEAAESGIGIWSPENAGSEWMSELVLADPETNPEDSRSKIRQAAAAKGVEVDDLLHGGDIAPLQRLEIDNAHLLDPTLPSLFDAFPLMPSTGARGIKLIHHKRPPEQKSGPRVSPRAAPSQEAEPAQPAQDPSSRPVSPSGDSDSSESRSFGGRTPPPGFALTGARPAFLKT